MASVFTVTELTAQGDGTYTFVDTGIKFEWDAARQSSPRNAWDYSIKLRTVREDYPGSDLPTEQVLGPNYEPFDLEGRWQDKYNFNGFAEQTRVDFEKMVQRGGKVRLELDKISITGLITNLKINYRNAFDIGYKFTFSPHFRSSGGDARQQKTQAPQPVSNPQDYSDQLAAQALAMRQIHADAPLPYLAGNLGPDVGAQLDRVVAASNGVQDILDNRVLAIDASTQVVNSVGRLAQSFNDAASAAAAIAPILLGYPTSLGLGYEDALSVLNFEVWARELCAQARLTLLVCAEAAAALAKQVSASGVALYRPHRNESLYGISNRFYGTPHHWHEIAERNGLTDFVLDGTELLIIPNLQGI